MSVSNNSDETVSESSSAGTAVMETQTPEAASATTSSTKNSDNVSTVETRNNIMSHQSVVVQRVPLKQMIINQKQSKQGSLSGIPRGTINLATIEGNITKLDVKQRAPISTATRQTFTYAVPNVASSRKPPVLKCSISPSAIFHWGHPQSAPSVSHLMTPQKVLVAATSSPSPPKSSENNHEPTGNTNHSPMFSLKPSTIFTNPDDTNGRVIDDGKSDPLYNPDGSDTPARPPYSYASLIAQAINSSDSGRMKLNDIYAWIIETYPYYKYQNSGWQNSIRHNLSLNKSFVKVANPSKESGKGSYWQIAEKDQEFFDGNGNFKKRRKSISGIGSAFPNSCSPDNGNPDLDICDDRADSLAGDISNFIQDPIDEYNFDISGVNPNSLNQVTAANNLSRSSIRKGPRKITRKRRIKPGEDEDEDDDPSMYEDDLDRGEGNILASDLNNETGTSNYTDENHSGAGNQANQYNHQSHNQLLKSRNDDGRVRKRSLNGSAKMTDLKGNNLLVDSGLLCSSGDIVPPNKGRRRGSVGCGNLGIDASKYESINRRRKSVPSVIFESDGSDMLGSFHSIPHMTLPDNPLLAIRERMYYDALVRDGITSFNSMDNGLTMNDVEKQSDNNRDIGTKTQGSFYDQGDVNPSVTTVSPGVATTDGGIEWPSHVQAKSLLVNHRNASEEAICDQKYSTSNLLDNGSIEITKGGPHHYQNVLANANNQHQHIYHFSNAVICDEGYDSLPSTRRSMTPFEVTVIQSPVSGDGRYDEVGKQQTGKRSKVTGDSASSHTMLMASNLLSCPELYDMSWPWMDTNSTLENKASKFSQEKDININSSPIIRSDTVDQGKHPNITLYDQNPGTTVTATTTINTFTTPSPSNANSSTHNPLRRLLSLSPSSLHCSGSSSSSSRNSCHPPDLSSTQPVVIQGPYSDFGSDPDNPNATSKDPSERYSSQSVAHMMKAMHEEIYGSSSPPDLSMFTAANNTSDPSAVALAFLGNSGNVVYDKSLGCSVTSSSASDPQEAIGSGTEDDKTWIHLVDLQKTEAS